MRGCPVWKRKWERSNLRIRLEEGRKLMPMETVEEGLLAVVTIGSYETGGVICNVEISRVVVDNSPLAIAGEVLSEPKL